MKLFSHNETNLRHNEIILLRKVSLWFDVFKIGRFESPNFDFCVVNFDTMKLIFCVKVSETLIPQGFLDIEKNESCNTFGIITFVLIWCGWKDLILVAATQSRGFDFGFVTLLGQARIWQPTGLSFNAAPIQVLIICPN